ncbi:MAG TPA: hypothetical protein ENI15_09760 [Spirochaetes bacterium]|nr:hypothetical protein [Spirochaetota bacterium]
MEQNTRLSIAAGIMDRFTGLTGLMPASKTPCRYLWTDAFAVCNFLGLFCQTGDGRYKNLALQLLDRVHSTLGRHREDDTRTGWISGLDEQEGKKHPTKGGLRIGKKMRERGPSDRFDQGLEWDRDGQYYHYLTKWMHALSLTGKATSDATYNRWAIELAKTAHAGFTYLPYTGGRKQMHWKMSIDLSRPLVPSMGQHDPLDGFITYNQLRMLAAGFEGKPPFPDLSEESADIASICEAKNWITDDPLGIGGLLFDACRVAQMIASRHFEQIELLETLLESSLIGMESFTKMDPLKLPAGRRLAFRELGLSIGIKAVEKLGKLIRDKPVPFKAATRLKRLVEAFKRYKRLAEILESFWLEDTSQKAGTWTDHSDINMVMLATSLAPDGFLTL